MLLPYDLAQKSKSDFIESFKDLYEHSPWVIEQSFAELTSDASHNQLEKFHQVLSATVQNASTELQMNLIKTHPTLAGKKAIANQLTDFSTGEQKSAGLNNCTDAEITTFELLNKEYHDKFRFPFIMAIKQKNKDEIFRSFTQRLNNSPVEEQRTALQQIKQIAWLRIKEIYGI